MAREQEILMTLTQLDAMIADAVAQRCAPLVEALEQCCRVSDHAGRIARKALAAYRAQEKAGGAEADRGE